MTTPAAGGAGSLSTSGGGASATRPSGDYAIDLTHVAKTYRGRRKITALRGIEMRVHRGEVFGLLGPNGAGKSTLVKILMTVISPSACRGTLLGDPVGQKSTLQRVGYLAEHHRFPEYLTGAQVLDYFGAMAKVPTELRKKRIPELLELVGMSSWANTRIKSYSKGMRQRVGIAQALMNDPDIVLLDEPTDGVDPVGRRDIRALVQHLKDRGKTVFINSHLLSELEMVCDRVAILVQGVVSKQGTLDELTRGRQCYEIDVAGDPRTAAGHFVSAVPGLTPTGRGALGTGEWVEIDEDKLRIGTTDPARVQPVLDAIRARGGVVRSLRPIRPSLEDLFMESVTDPTTGQVLQPGAAGGGGAPSAGATASTTASTTGGTR